MSSENITIVAVEVAY